MEDLFVYGSLREPDMQKKVIGRIASSEKDVLEGFRRSTVELEGTTYPIIFPDPNGGSPIEGFILSLTSEELKRVDEYETDAYQRKRVILKSGRNAWIYQR